MKMRIGDYTYSVDRYPVFSFSPALTAGLKGTRYEKCWVLFWAGLVIGKNRPLEDQ